MNEKLSKLESHELELNRIINTIDSLPYNEWCMINEKLPGICLDTIT